MAIMPGPVLVCWLALVALVTNASVMMRQEECQRGSVSAKCKTSALDADTQSSAQDSNLRMSVLGVDVPDDPDANPVSRYTPLPFAAFMQPRPVYQSSEEKVFNVLERERTMHRLLKGGKRQEDRIKSNVTLSESEDSSKSNVQFRRRKGGKRSDRRKQLRRERIERKRARRKNRRKNRQEKRKKSKHPKHRKGRKRKNKRGKLKSLNPSGGRRRNRNEQVGVNPTVFIEDDVPAALELPPKDDIQNDHMQLQSRNIVQETFLSDSGINSRDQQRQTDQALQADGSPSPTSRPHLDVANYHESNVEFDDYEDDEADDLMTDMEYSSRGEDDYQISPEYFNWKDNSSFDYFTQGEDTTVTPDTWNGPWQLDPSHIQTRRHLVRLHNLLRSKVDPPAANMLALSWHGAAATQARQWAESCVAHRGRDHPSVRWTPRYGACGQNVLVTRRKRRWAHVIRNWWGERRFFQYGSTEVRNATYRARSYTQLAWYSSHKVGCGYSQCSTVGGRIFHRYVCNYCPAGNDPSRLSLPYTRGRPCEMCPNACRSVCPEGQCRLCTNRCPFSDLWANCDTLAQRWREWLCNTKTLHGVERFKNCRATCQCALAGDKIL